MHVISAQPLFGPRTITTTTPEHHDHHERDYGTMPYVRPAMLYLRLCQISCIRPHHRFRSPALHPHRNNHTRTVILS